MSLLIAVYGAVQSSCVEQFQSTLRSMSITSQPVAVIESVFENIDRGRSRKSSECRIRRPLKSSSSSDEGHTLRILGHLIDPSRHQAVVRSISETPVSSNCQALLTATDFRLVFTVALNGITYYFKDRQTVQVVQLSPMKGGDDASAITSGDDLWLVELSTTVSTADGEISGVESNLLQFARQLMGVTDVVFTFSS